MFRSLIIPEDFEPFGSLELSLPPVHNRPEGVAEVHLLAGANGAGKSRLLAVLAGMLGNAEPLKVRLPGGTGGFAVQVSESAEGGNPGSAAERYVASSARVQWGGQGAVSGWCQRVPAFAYSGTAYIQDEKMSLMAPVSPLKREEALKFDRTPADSAPLIQAITNLTLQAAIEMKSRRAAPLPSHRATRLLTALESTVASITGRPFSFAVTPYPEPRLSVSCGERQIAFNALADGLRAIIGWLVHAGVMLDAQLQGNENPLMAEVVFLLDEIETHLHPAWQRRLLPAFQLLFPRSIMIVATHSPFVVASLEHGWIHALAVDDNGQASLRESIEAGSGKSTLSVYEELMGGEDWNEPETKMMLARYRELREAIATGESHAHDELRELATKIAGRSLDLGFVMGQELAQMEQPVEV